VEVSRIERDLTSPDADDALGEMFSSDDFESSLDEALDEAEVELELEFDDAESSDAPGTDDRDDDHDAVATDDHEGVADDVPERESPIEGIVDADIDSSDPMFDVLPAIILATPDGPPENGATADRVVEPHVAPDVADEVDDDEAVVSDRILEELRYAEIAGPVVSPAQQDDTTAARRRPRRDPDYDPAPVPIPARVPRVLGRKPRVRKVTRVVRHVDPWSVFKIALAAHLVLYVTVLTASVLLWNVAYSTNTINNVERFFESFGWQSFEFNGGELYHAGWIAGLFIVIGLTGLAVLAATLFNLITDLVGGVRFTVLEEEVVEARTSPMRRFVVRRSEPEVPAVLQDGAGVMTREAVVDDTGANDRPTR
jgi:hypothetical protein